MIIINKIIITFITYESNNYYVNMMQIPMCLMKDLLSLEVDKMYILLVGEVEDLCYIY